MARLRIDPVTSGSIDNALLFQTTRHLELQLPKQAKMLLMKSIKYMAYKCFHLRQSRHNGKRQKVRITQMIKDLGLFMTLYTKCFPFSLLFQNYAWSRHGDPNVSTMYFTGTVLQYNVCKEMFISFRLCLLAFLKPETLGKKHAKYTTMLLDTVNERYMHFYHLFHVDTPKNVKEMLKLLHVYYFCNQKFNSCNNSHTRR